MDQIEMIKTKATAIILGLGLAVTSFAQTSPRPKGRPLAAKPATPPKAKPVRPDSPRPATGPTVVKAKRKPSQLVAALDANNDGKLSLKEIEAAVEVLKKLDANKDGELTLQEFGPVPEEEASKGPRFSGALGVAKPPVAASKPSVRPGRRPSGKPGARPAQKPSALASRLPGAKKPGARPTRPSAKPRPSARPVRRVAKTGASDTTARVEGTSSASSAKPKRVARAAISGRQSKTASRRRPAPATAKPAAVATPEDAALRALIDDTQAVTAQLKKAIGSINDSGKKQAALKWVRSGSRIMLRSLNAGLKAKDAARKENEAATARQKLEEVSKLLE